MLLLAAVQEDQFLDVINEVSYALILVAKLRQFLLQMSHGLLFFLFVVDARATGAAGLELHQPLLVPLFAPILQL